MPRGARASGQRVVIAKVPPSEAAFPLDGAVNSDVSSSKGYEEVVPRRLAQRLVAPGSRDTRLVGFAERAVLVRRHQPPQPDPDRAILESDLELRLRAKRGAASPESRPHGSRAHRYGRA